MTKQIKGFVEFIREQGVMTLAIGFLLGGAVTRVVQSFVTDIVNPLIGLLMGSAESLKEAKWTIGTAVISWGNFVAVLIDFTIVAAVVYVGMKILKLDSLDKKKPEKK
jgi:large conductance mechanosensitive channel